MEHSLRLVVVAVILLVVAAVIISIAVNSSTQANSVMTGISNFFKGLLGGKSVNTQNLMSTGSSSSGTGTTSGASASGAAASGSGGTPMAWTGAAGG
jgi:hypothetical protein